MVDREHSPIRKIQAENLPKPVGPYSPGIAFERLVFVSGQSGRDPLTGRTAEGVEAQTEQTLRNIETILKAAGTDLQHVLRCGVFLMDMTEFPKMNAVYERRFPNEIARQARKISKPNYQADGHCSKQNCRNRISAAPKFGTPPASARRRPTSVI